MHKPECRAARNAAIAKLLAEHSDLPTMCWIDGTLKSGMEPSEWCAGKLTSASIEDITFWDDAPDSEGGLYWEKSRVDEIRQHYEDSWWNADEIDARISKLKWKTYILLRIDVP